MKFVYYTEADEKVWDEFIDLKSINGTFLQTRRFLNYHPKDRFRDCSLLIYDEKSRLIAICPACDQVIDGKRTFFSHMGSTFGGIIIDKKYYRTEKVIRVIEELKLFLKNEGFMQMYIKMPSDIFCMGNGDLFQYAFFYEGFKQYIELSTYVDFSKYKEEILLNFSQGKRTNVHNAKKNALVMKKIESIHELEIFYSILCENLEKYNVKPVHTLEELIRLMQDHIKEEIEFFGIYQKDKMIAGGMMFYFFEVGCAHTQYLAARQEYNRLSPMTFLYYSILELMKKRGFSKVSWGTVTENRGTVINMGLVSSKESYGGDYCNNYTYFCDLRN